MAFRSMGFRSMEIRPKVNTKLVVRIFFAGGGWAAMVEGKKNHCILIFSKSITQDLKNYFDFVGPYSSKYKIFIFQRKILLY